MNRVLSLQLAYLCLSIFGLYTLGYGQTSNLEEIFMKSINEKRQQYLNKEKLYENDLKILEESLQKLNLIESKEVLKKLKKELDYKYSLNKSYSIDIYFSHKYKYNYDQKKMLNLPLDLILDILKKRIDNSRIIRMNNVNFKSFGRNGKFLSSEFDNTFFDLKDEPQLKNIKELKKILLTTIINKEKKQTIEWIWGRSIENSAYYSTKLTIFKGVFSLYPIYRTFIGIDSFRNKKSWFYSLKEFEHESLMNKNLLLCSFKNKNKSHSNNTIHKVINPKNYREIYKSFRKYAKEQSKLTVNSFYYRKKIKSKKHKLNFADEIKISELIEFIFKNKDKELILKVSNLKNLNLPVEFNNLLSREIFCLKDTDIEKVYKIVPSQLSTLTPKEQFRLFKDFYAIIFAFASKKSKIKTTIELIYDRQEGSQNYRADVATVFQDQLTIFENYKRIVSREDYNNKNGWFYAVEINKILPLD